MTELIWVNGKVTKLSEATANYEDRGHQFADGVYEVVRVYKGRGGSGGGVPFTLTEHLERLMRSADGIRLDVPYRVDEIAGEVRKLIDTSGLQEGMVYMQLTRGIAPRNHLFPKKPVPTLYFFTRELPPVPAPGTAEGVKLVTVEDERWKRCWVKSIALLANVLAKNEAAEKGADEAVFSEGGTVTECSASNLFAVGRGVLVTAPVGPKVLPGITRQVLLEVAAEQGIPVIERNPTEYECRCGEELFITSTTRELSWVSHWNGVQIHDRPGEITLRLHRAFQERVRREVGAYQTAMV
jgi:D-alanine transaminase